MPEDFPRTDLSAAPTEDLIAEVCNRFDQCVFVAKRPAYMTGDTSAMHVIGSPNDYVTMHGLLQSGSATLIRTQIFDPPPGPHHP